MTLAEAKIKKEYRIKNITEGAGSQRLFEFGFTQGVRLCVEQIAPFHGAMLICIRKSLVVLDFATADLIAVEEVRV
jgi:Fe2+ transport system protein FeoA